MKKLTLLFAFGIQVSIFESSFAGNCISQCTGDWENSSTWFCGRVPVCGDTIIIESGNEVTINIQQDYYSFCFESMYITVNGTLSFKTGKKLMLPPGSVVEINIGGTLDPGNGGGSSNLIDIGGVNVWSADQGRIDGYAIYKVNPLPIRILEFNAIQSGHKIEINWATGSETNNDYFTIEKTREGEKYEIVATIDGAGNSNSIRNYRVVDNSPCEGLSYYRLKQTDFDGKHEFSKIVAVRFNERSSLFNIYPNPSQRKNIFLRGKIPCSREIRITIRDIEGKEQFTKICKCNNYFSETIEIEKQLSEGIYFISAKSETDSFTRRLVVQ